MATSSTNAINERTAAALYVVSHHTVQYGMIASARVLPPSADASGVPVIVDAASEYDLKGFLAQGADIVIYSAATSSSAGRPPASSPGARISCAPPICRTAASAAA